MHKQFRSSNNPRLVGDGVFHGFDSVVQNCRGRTVLRVDDTPALLLKNSDLL